MNLHISACLVGVGGEVFLHHMVGVVLLLLRSFAYSVHFSSRSERWRASRRSGRPPILSALETTWVIPRRSTVAPEVMTDEQMYDQAVALKDALIFYRAYLRTDASKSWARYAGVLRQSGSTWEVEVGPEFNCIPLVVQQTTQ